MPRRLLRIATVSYAALLAVGLAALEWWGERNWFVSLALFAPAWLMLAPLLILSPWALVMRQWKILIVQVLCSSLVIFGYMTFRWSPRPERGPDTVKLISHNVGQGNKEQFRDFLDTQQADIILLQDAKFRAGQYAKRFPDHYVAARGEFVCVSRYLIQQASLLENPSWNNRPVAARFEVLVHGRPVALYNVHLPTPRPQFNRLMSSRLLAEIFGEEEQAGPFTGYRTWNAARIKLAQDLVNRIQTEPRPYVAAGDFNMPDHGFIYHTFADRMTDAFAKSGRGWGLTFPGGTRGRAARVGPWLRIDFVFVGKGLKSVFCEAEPGRKSQHRALVAMIEPSTTE